MTCTKCHGCLEHTTLYGGEYDTHDPIPAIRCLNCGKYWYTRSKRPPLARLANHRPPRANTRGYVFEGDTP